MVFYALGCGVKGIGYFADITSETGEEKFLGASDIESLWAEIGRTNSDTLALAPYLSIGCPIPTRIPSDEVWARALLCGSDHIALIIVNKGHWIGFETKYEHAWHTPAKDVHVSVPLPRTFLQCAVQEVRDGKFVPAKAFVKGGKAQFDLDTVDTARAFVITRKGK